MKKIKLLLISIFIINLSNVSGQIYTGVFKTTTDNSDYHHFTRNHATGAAVYINQVSTGPILKLSSGIFDANQNVKFTVEYNGNVGIGTTNPSTNLHISNENSVLRLESTASTSSTNKIDFFSGKIESGDKIIGKLAGYSESTGDVFTERASVEFKTALGHGSYWQPPTNILFKTNGDNVDNLLTRMIIDYKGNVGIGTTDPTYKLSVKGIIGCGEIIVEDVSVWADFVFEEDYNLMSLKELDNFIQKNKHLPEIPTTAEVEEKGISVGEMNSKLLQKIEELTLYTIQQQELIEALKSSVEAQNKRIDQLENK